MKRKIPEFIAQNPSTEEKQRLMKQYLKWKKWEIAEMMVNHYQKKLDRLIQEDEKDSPVSWFQWKWGKAKRLGKREALRQFINDLKE